MSVFLTREIVATLTVRGESEGEAEAAMETLKQRVDRALPMTKLHILTERRNGETVVPITQRKVEQRVPKR